MFCKAHCRIPSMEFCTNTNRHRQIDRHGPKIFFLSSHLPLLSKQSSTNQ
uniref:Uncharacterized protein n=1 Tax=Anguilla anguilla TaxID=7936 RepID=A0A0E9PLQ1_ANGAN